MSNDRKFTDRIEPQKIFRQKYTAVKSENVDPVAIIFYGEGGIGKTRLLKELTKKLSSEKDIACVHYDFENIFDMRTILLTLKNQLVKQGFDFPLFETGNFFYNIKIDNAEVVDAPKIKSALNTTTWLRDILSAADFFIPGANALAIVTTKIFDVIYQYINEDKVLLEEMKNVVEVAKNADNPYELYQLLPQLFATDIKNYFNGEQHEKKALVVFLDTYEKLVNEAVGTYEERARDLWLRGEGSGLMSIMPNTLWVIAGRSNLRWGGSYTRFPVHLEEKISALDKNYAEEFLEKSGVESPVLREGIFNLTQGSPIFLTLCVDIYEQFKKRWGMEPDISEFGSEREKVAKRILKYIDPSTQDMLKFLCILNSWTDDIANEIGIKVLPFSETTYNQIKNFSFVTSEKITINDFSETVYSFDKTTQAALFPECSERMIKKTKKAANKYFNELFEALPELYDEYIFNVVCWAKLISRLSNDDEELFRQYEENISYRVFELTDMTFFDDAESVINAYFEKILNAENKNSKSYALFELETSSLKSSQGFYQDAFNYAESAYKKFLAFPEEKEKNSDATIILANTLVNLGHYEEALEIQEKFLELCKENLGENHPDTLLAMNNLATTLSYLGSYEQALEMQEKVLELDKETLGENHPDTLIAMNNLALTLSDLGRYEESLALKEKVLELDKETLGENHPNTIIAISNLSVILGNLGRHQESLALKEKVLELDKETLGEKHPDTLIAVDSLVLTLKDLERYEEALKFQEKLVELYKEILGEKHRNTINAMNSLSLTLNILERHNEALKLQEKVFELRKEIFGENHTDTLVAMNNLAMTLRDLESYEDALALQKKVLKLTKETLAENNGFFIHFLANLASIQYLANHKDDSLKNIKRAQEIQNKYFPEDAGLIKKIAEVYALITAEKIDAPKKITVVKTQKLIKGQRADLTKNNPDLKNLLAEFILSAPLNFEIDATAFLLDKNGKVLNDEDFIFYGNLKYSSGGMEYLQAADSNKLQINIELEKNSRRY